MRPCQARCPGEGASGLHLKGLGAIKIKGEWEVARVCGKSLHSRQSDKLEQWQDIRDQVKELQAVLGAELQSWKEANDEASETIRDQHVKGNKDGRAKNDFWVSITGGDGQRDIY